MHQQCVSVLGSVLVSGVEVGVSRVGVVRGRRGAESLSETRRMCVRLLPP